MKQGISMKGNDFELALQKMWTFSRKLSMLQILIMGTDRAKVIYVHTCFRKTAKC